MWAYVQLDHVQAMRNKASEISDLSQHNRQKYKTSIL